MARSPNEHITPDLRRLSIPLKNLNLDPKNARKHGKTDVAALSRMLEAFKQRTPLVVQKEGMVVRKGNGTLMAAELLGWGRNTLTRKIRELGME